MAFFTDLDEHLGVLRAVVGADVDAAALPATVIGACDADVLRIVAETTAIIEAAGSLRIAAAGVLAARSRREQGRSGVAAGEGHRNAVSLVQEITGTTRSEASKQVRLGESLLGGADLLGRGGGGRGEGAVLVAVRGWRMRVSRPRRRGSRGMRRWGAPSSRATSPRRSTTRSSAASAGRLRQATRPSTRSTRRRGHSPPSSSRARRGVARSKSSARPHAPYAITSIRRAPKSGSRPGSRVAPSACGKTNTG